jgi:hypothetical protein
MKRFIFALGIAAIAATAVFASVASANVVANPDGTTSIGKGDVQNALGYANDAAFQKDTGSGQDHVQPGVR